MNTTVSTPDKKANEKKNIYSLWWQLIQFDINVIDVNSSMDQNTELHSLNNREREKEIEWESEGNNKMNELFEIDLPLIGFPLPHQFAFDIEHE